jgi:hypothetical protein
MIDPTSSDRAAYPCLFRTSTAIASALIWN